MRPKSVIAICIGAALAAGFGGALVGAGPAGDQAAAAAIVQARPAAVAPAPAAALQAQYVAVVKKVTPSVVQIESEGSLGSGVIFDRTGHIVTNAHVVGSQTQFTVTLANGKRYPGRLIGAFAAGDLAVVKIEVTGLRPLPLARSSKLQVGHIVLALGSPLGLQSSVTEGIVSARRTVTEPDGATIPLAVQTSAPINPGNSGGALVNLNGRLVGIPTLVLGSSIGGQAAGIGFAIPSDTVRDIASQLIRFGRVVNSHRPFLGVQVSDTIEGDGVYLAEVNPGGPAAKAGLRTGDIITAIAGKETLTTSDLSSVLAGFKPGQTVAVTVRRANGSTTTVRVTLGEFPGS
jgi:S1-C subfamily serine protease